jgi:hypothetical protein
MQARVLMEFVFIWQMSFTHHQLVCAHSCDVAASLSVSIGPVMSSMKKTNFIRLISHEEQEAAEDPECALFFFF